MSRPLPASYQPLDPADIGALVEVGTVAEDVISDNIHHVYGYWWPTMISTIFSGDIDAAAGVQPYVVGRNPASKEVAAIWSIDLPLAPAESVTITVLYQTTTADAHTIRFDWASDPWVAGPTGTFVDLVAAGGSGQWTVVTGTLALPAGVDDDALRMWAINDGATGEVRVHSVDVRPADLSSVAAGGITEGSISFVPDDTIHVDQDSPLTTARRNAQWQNSEYVRKTRPGHVLGWAENAHFRAGQEAYSVAGASYVRIITLPIAVPLGSTVLRWALYGYRSGAAGSVSLTTLTDATAGTAAQECALAAGWTSPYAGSLHRYDDGGKSALGVTGPTDPAMSESWMEEVRIELKGDGSSSRLMGLCLWFGPETA